MKFLCFVFSFKYVYFIYVYFIFGGFCFIYKYTSEIWVSVH